MNAAAVAAVAEDDTGAAGKVVPDPVVHLGLEHTSFLGKELPTDLSFAQGDGSGQGAGEEEEIPYGSAAFAADTEAASAAVAAEVDKH